MIDAKISLDGFPEGPLKYILQYLRGSQWFFFLTGSRAMTSNLSPGGKDWDFFVQDDGGELPERLLRMGFSPVEGNYEDFEPVTIYRHPVGVDIEIVPKANNLLRDQETIREYFRGVYEALPKEFRGLLWEGVHRIQEDAVRSWT